VTSIRVLFSRILDLLLRRQREERLSEELQAHLDFLTDEYVASGMSEDEARLAARRSFGGVDQARMRYRDQRGLPSVDGLLQDLRFATRLLTKDRRFTITAVVALALGIGVTNTVFTIVNTAELRDLPFDQPDQLISIATRTADGRTGATSFADFQDWQRSTKMFAGLAASSMTGMNLSDDGRPPERLRGAFVSANAFQLLRVAPLIGRDFLPEDDRPGAPAVAIISYGIWQAHYGGDLSVIGRQVRVNEMPTTIVGVMPPGFGFPAFQDAWQPLAHMPSIQTARRDARRLNVFARLTDAAELPQARAVMDTIASQLAREHPETNKDTTASVVRLRDHGVDNWPILTPLLVAVGFVLLIACANVANLLLARSVSRAREIAIRASLGATRWRIVRQLLIECVLVAFLAGGLGLMLSKYGVSLLGVGFDLLDVAGPGQSNTPYWVNLSMNWPVFVFVAVLCLVSGLAFGIVPALHISKTDVNETLKDGGRGDVGGRRARRWTSTFVVSELALTMILLASAALLWRNFLTVYRSDAIIDASDLVTMRLTVPVERYATAEQVQAFHRQMDERLASRAETFRAAVGSYLPYGPDQGPLAMTIRHISMEGRDPVAGTPPPSARYALAGPRYFETLGLPVIRGRALSARDEQPGQEGAVVDQRLVTMFFADEDPIGQRIQLSAAGPQATQTSPWLTIVGVVPTLRPFGGERFANPVVYAPLTLEPMPRNVVVFARRPVSAERAGGHHIAIEDDPQLAAIVSGARDEVRAVDANLPVFGIETMEATLARTRVSSRLFGMWFGMLAAIALVLASVGLYALTAHSVASRTQEIGVRMALGAQAAEVVWLFLRRSFAQLAVGLTLGLGGALAAGQVLQSMLMGTDPRDGLTLAVVCAVLIIVSIVACLIPARRAARLDPVIALRKE
jgi:putative ABC transport system permease protein